MKKITYVTGNWAKILSAKQKLEPLGFEIEQVKLDVPEVQDNLVENVSKFSAKWASEKLKCDVLKNDTGLCVEALNGFPGPYTHYVQDTLTEDGLLKLLEGVENRKAYFIESLAYCEYGKEPVVFNSVTHGSISKVKSGKYGWSWDLVFIPEGQNKTLANFDDSIRFNYWDTTAYDKLAKYLKDK